MAQQRLDLTGLENDLATFVNQYRRTIQSVFSTFAQRFEAYCFMTEVGRLRDTGANPRFINPNGSPEVRLKFSTRGRPENYTYVEFSVPGRTLELRHNQKVRSAHASHHRDAAFCLDLAFVRAGSIQTDGLVNNRDLVSFWECKNMGAFPELVASFVGLVHEVKPRVLDSTRRPTWFTRMRVRPPTLATAGVPSPGALAVWQTIRGRGLCLRVQRYDPVSDSLEELQ